MKTKLFVIVSLGFLPFFISAQSNPNERENTQDSTSVIKEKSTKLERLIEFTISQIEEHDRNSSVILYSNARFSGERFELEHDWSANGRHDYWNNEISSIEVPRGLEVWIYQYKNFEGEVLCVRGD